MKPGKGGLDSLGNIVLNVPDILRLMLVMSVVVSRAREREIERYFFFFNFLKVHLGDSNRQPQSSRENLE